MANEEEKELESVLKNKENETPSRADGKEKPKTKNAKLTGRTISSLKAKIKEKRLSRAYDKYNKNYREMRRALVEANRLKTAQEKGEEVTNSEVVEAFDVVASYDKKLAKYGVKLLKDDIKKVVADKKPRPIRVPRILLGKLRPITKAIVNAVERKKEKKLQKGLSKDIQKATKDYMRDSLEGAIFKDSVNGDLREAVDANVIQGLATDKKAATFEDKIANLRRFISEDGKKSIFGEEQIGNKEKTNTDVPPVAPVASVEKEDKKVTTEDLLGDLGKKPNVPEENVEIKTEANKEDKPEEKVESKITVEDLIKNLNKTPATKEPEVVVKPEEKVEPKVVESQEAKLSDEDKKLISRRKREIATIISLGNTIDTLEQQAAKTNDPVTKEAIRNYIEALNNDLNNIINKSIEKEEKAEKVVEPVREEPKTMTQPVKAESMEPIVIEPKEETKVVEPKVETRKDEIVKVKNTDLTIRAEQISNPSVLKFTPQDIRNMEERNRKAKLQIANLTQQRQDLEAQRDMLKQYIEVAETTRAAEMQAQEMAKSNATLAGEVAELSSQAAAINSDLGRAK